LSDKAPDCRLDAWTVAARRKKARRGGYIAAGFLSLSEERTFPPRNASGRLLRRNAALPE